MLVNISIIIPTYNNLKLLKKCIQSFETQITKGDQVIIVDDGSTDGTFEYLIDKYGEDEKFLIINQKNNGSGSARNTGIKKVLNDYIWFIDADDTITNDAIEKVKRIISEKDLDIIFFNYKKIDENFKEVEVNLQLKMESKNELFLQSHYPWNKVFKKELFSNIYFPSKIRFQDLATIPKVISRADRIGYIVDSIYRYDFSHEGNIGKNSKKDEDIYKACNILFDGFRAGDLRKEEIELLLINTLVFQNLNKVYLTASSFKDRLNKFKRIENLMDQYLKNWRNSDCFSLGFYKKYKYTVKYLLGKVLVGKIFSFSPIIALIFLSILTKVQKMIRIMKFT